MELRNPPVQIVTADKFYAHIFPEKPLLANSLFPHNPVIYVWVQQQLARIIVESGKAQEGCRA